MEKQLFCNSHNNVEFMLFVFHFDQIYMAADCKWASTGENLSSGVCQQHRRRPACASAQTDQRLCYSLIEKYHVYLNITLSMVSVVSYIATSSH